MASRSASSTQPQAVEVGVVVKPHGVRGLLKIHLHNPGSEALSAANASHLWLRSPSGEVFKPVSPEGDSRGQAIVAIAGVSDRDGAEALRGAALMLDREAIELEQGQYLYVDLIGCHVVQRGLGDKEQRKLGEVCDVFEAGASDVLVVRDGKRQRMIPLVDEWVLSVDLDSRIIEVDEAWED